jgi:hypothetical protein
MFCPKCGHPGLEGEEFELGDEDIYVQLYWCENCGKKSVVGPDELGMRSYGSVHQNIDTVGPNSSVTGIVIG